MTRRIFSANPRELRLLLSWVLTSLIATHVGANVMSRFAAIFSACNGEAYQIDRYGEWTEDWSRTPDGRTWSNKAPGGILIATPWVCVLEGFRNQLSTNSLSSEPAADPRVQNEWRFRYVANLTTSLIFQVLPWALLALLFLRDLSTTDPSRMIFLVALLTGTTAAIYANTYFGHALTAVAALAAVWASEKRRWVLWGFALSFCLLNEYTALLLLPGLAAAAFIGERDRDPAFNPIPIAARALLGALPCAVAWALYHSHAFGNPFRIANHFQNPKYIDASDARFNVLGVFKLPPSPEAAFELLFGFQRGILWTQPWILILIVGVLTHRRWRAAIPSSRLLAALSGFALLYLMNASFGAWHGGFTVGPRYMSPVLPLFALWLPPLWPSLRRAERIALTGSIAASAFFFVLCRSTTVTPTPGAVWLRVLDVLTTDTAMVTINLAIFAGLSWWTTRGARRGSPLEGLEADTVRDQ